MRLSRTYLHEEKTETVVRHVCLLSLCTSVYRCIHEFVYVCVGICAYCVLYIVYAVRNNEEFAQTGIPTFFKQEQRGQTVLRTVDQIHSATNRTLFPSLPHFTLDKHTSHTICTNTYTRFYHTNGPIAVTLAQQAHHKRYGV